MRVGYSFSNLEKIIIVVLALLILFLSIYGSFITFHCNECFITNTNIKILFIIETFQVISSVFILGLFLYKFFKKNVPIHDENYFIEKMNELFNDGKYSSVFALMEENYDSFFDLQNKKIEF